VRSPRGDVELGDLSVSTPDDPLPATDVVVVCTKTTGNDELAGWLASQVEGDGTSGTAPVVVILQNGLGVEEPFAAALAGVAPGVVVLGAMSFICSARTAPGVIDHTDYERVTVGATAPGGAADVAVAAVVEDFAGAQVPTEALSDLVAGRWRKLAWNIPFNGLSVVLDATTAEMVGDPSCRQLVVDIMGEVVAGAAGCGHPVGERTIEDLLASTEAMVPYAPSMKLDYDARRPLELDAIYAAPIGAAAQAGVDMPAASALWRQLAFLDRRNRHG
jgi:2-dehydropantoate 2-reductase